ncbi:Similarity [Microcystis aeruginosa PCC 9808]|uniref:Similarity n=1 Tax=Microcystis aeruginosa PCC 9808 TaxID=1160284 RepID=I4HTQ8_MICAE|nr:Similarity [Microcystis aeruginosa PCC 9808]
MMTTQKLKALVNTVIKQSQWQLWHLYCLSCGSSDYAKIGQLEMTRNDFFNSRLGILQQFLATISSISQTRHEITSL